MYGKIQNFSELRVCYCALYLLDCQTTLAHCSTTHGSFSKNSGERTSLILLCGLKIDDLNSSLPRVGDKNCVTVTKREGRGGLKRSHATFVHCRKETCMWKKLREFVLQKEESKKPLDKSIFIFWTGGVFT